MFLTGILLLVSESTNRKGSYRSGVEVDEGLHVYISCNLNIRIELIVIIIEEWKYEEI